MEPLLVAAIGLLLLHDPLTPAMAAAILIAVAGVALISVKPDTLTGGAGPALLGLSSAGLFAASAIGYRGAILALHAPGYLLPATFTLAVGPHIADRPAAGLAAALQPRDAGGACPAVAAQSLRQASPARRRRNSGFWPSPLRPPPAFGPWR